MNCYKTDLFINSIYSFKLNIDLNEINNFCIDYEKNNLGRVLSNFNGFQSNNLDFNIPIVNKLSFIILQKVNFVFKKYYKTEHNLNISSIWFNINRHKDSNNRHMHPDSMLSGVFYSKVPNNSGDIRFYNSENFEIHFANVNKIIEPNEHNSCTYLLKSEASFLHIFPGFLNHCVNPNLSNEERISFSFNTSLAN